MAFLSFVRTRGYRNFMSKLYGIGAAVVIMGALFKINHYSGANAMLILGLCTESVIFFFSAFEPPHVEPDWSLVYPELAGMYTEEHGAGGPKLKDKDLTKELDKMLSNAKIGPELIDSLSKGLHSLSSTTAQLSNVSNAAVATDEYVKNMKVASQTVGGLSEKYQKTADAMGQDIAINQQYQENLKVASASVGSLAGAYKSTAEAVKEELNAAKEFSGSVVSATESVRVLTDNYKKSSDLLSKSAAALDFSSIEGGAYSQSLQKIAKNLEALNSVYELQLKANQKQTDASGALEERLGAFVKNINESIEKTTQYKQGVDILAQNVAALNKVYGNMLAAMNVNVSSK